MPKNSQYRIEGYIIDELADSAFASAKEQLQKWYFDVYHIEKSFSFLDENNQSIEDWVYETRYLDYWKGEYVKKAARAPNKRRYIEEKIKRAKYQIACGTVGEAIICGNFDVVVGDYIYDYYEQYPIGRTIEEILNGPPGEETNWVNTLHIFGMLDEAAAAMCLHQLEEELARFEDGEAEKETTKKFDVTRSDRRQNTNDFNDQRLIKWNGENTQLIYLFEQLKDAGLVADIELVAALEKCFLDKSGKPIRNLHQTRSNMFLNDGRRPKRKANLIDEIIQKTQNRKD